MKLPTNAILIRFIWVILFGCSAPGLAAQTFQLSMLWLDSDSLQVSRLVDQPAPRYPSESLLKASLAQFIDALHQQAYWEASVDTLIQQDSTFTALMHLGPAYQWVQLSLPDKPPGWLRKTGFREKLFREKPLAFEQWQNLQQRISQEAAQHGYPFASVYLDSLQWAAPGQLQARIGIDLGPLIILEALQQTGELQLTDAYLAQYLGLQAGTPYNEEVIQRIPQRLQELPFVRLAAPPLVQFVGNIATVQLKLAAKPASRFDFVVGVLPNSNQTGRLLVTGQLDGELQNALGKGEALRIQFEQLRPQTQALDLALNYPYLLGLPFGIDGQLELYRRDTNYLDLGWRLGIRYQLDGRRAVQAYWTRQQTNLLGFDENQILNQQRLPDTLDVRRSSFGASFEYTQLDYRFNPRKGWSLRFGGSAGQKEIRRNQQIENLGLENLYDSLVLRSGQYRIELAGACYWSWGLNSVFKIGFTGAAIIGGERVLANEQFRIGGNRLLRGFDEESIFATNYQLATLEYRFLLGQNSYLYAFWDAARTDELAVGTPTDFNPIDWPMGIGTGITFDTRAGVFGLSLAFGRQRGLPFDFGSPKVHFGYVSLF